MIDRVLPVKQVPRGHPVLRDKKVLMAIRALPVTLATLVLLGIRVLKDPKEKTENWENKDQGVKKEPRVQR